MLKIRCSRAICTLFMVKGLFPVVSVWIKHPGLCEHCCTWVKQPVPSKCQSMINQQMLATLCVTFAWFLCSNRKYQMKLSPMYPAGSGCKHLLFTRWERLTILCKVNRAFCELEINILQLAGARRVSRRFKIFVEFLKNWGIISKFGRNSFD